LTIARSANAADLRGGVRVHFAMCFTGGGYNCVVDGDTIWLRGVKIRIADIDAPETHDPRCASEKELGDRATVRLQQLLNAGVVSLETVDRDHDRYGRELRIVDVDGQSVGTTLVAEGLAREWDGARHPWC
jgi:endonuclease YncB( thermonuclease family)